MVMKLKSTSLMMTKRDYSLNLRSLWTSYVRTERLLGMSLTKRRMPKRLGMLNSRKELLKKTMLLLAPRGLSTRC